MKKILFLTGTRADYGKIKSLMKQVQKSKRFELNIFVTGMHMLSKYGSTWIELNKDGFDKNNIYHFINQKIGSHMDEALSNTITGLSNYVHESKPDMIVVHGDRLEALAGAIVGAFNNIKVAHIEGGEVSGTIDESIRHAITKFSHIHFVSNDKAKRRIVQLGEKDNDIYVIGSPDIDIMMSNELPTIQDSKVKYDIDFLQYGIVMYHPVTTEIHKLKRNVQNLVDALLSSQRNYIVIYPNNDEGNQIILNEYQRFIGDRRFKIFPSVKFEHFLTFLKNSDFVIGNSSAGVREAGVYGIPSIDVGERQKNRYNKVETTNIIHVNEDKKEILKAIEEASCRKIIPHKTFGDGKSDERFINILENEAIWQLQVQKNFIDIKY